MLRKLRAHTTDRKCERAIFGVRGVISGGAAPGVERHLHGPRPPEHYSVIEASADFIIDEKPLDSSPLRR
jgi:hypothetical protein